MVVYMTTTKDRLKLPTGVYDDWEDLLVAQRISDSALRYQTGVRCKDPWIFKIEIEEEES